MTWRRPIFIPLVVLALLPSILLFWYLRYHHNPLVPDTVFINYVPHVATSTPSR